MQHTTQDYRQCPTFTWCNGTGHDDDHCGARTGIAATGDPETYDYDHSNGGAVVPTVAAYLAATGDGPAGVALNVYVPGRRTTGVDVTMTLREARVLRDTLTELLEEVGR
ncbi:MAG TPA: hypothetical protein VGE38_09910 [Nocardioides sp.]|uniref:hypothetical protein n=1 Tax=Nocardioides sp. TaxID=35761 RepID=UPI002EDA0543